MTNIVKIIIFIIILFLWILKISLANYEYVENNIIESTLNKVNKNESDIIFIYHKSWFWKLKSEEKDKDIDFNNVMLLEDFNLYQSGALSFWEQNFQKNIFYFEKLVNKSNFFKKYIDNQNYNDNPFLNTELFFSHLSLWNYNKAYKYNEKLINLLNKNTNLTIYNFYINYYSYIDKEKVQAYLKYLEKNNLKNNLIYWDIFFLSEIKNYNKAEKYYNLALSKKYNIEYINNQLGLIYDYKYNYKKSLKLYNKSFKIDEDNILTLKNLCISRYLNFKYLVLNTEKNEKEKNIIKNWSNEALLYCNAYLEKEKKDKYIIWDAETYKYIWHIYNLWLWNIGKAKDFYLKSIKINPYDYKSFNNLSAIYRKIFEKNKKEEDLSKNIEYAEKFFLLKNNDFFRENLIISYHLAINYYVSKNNFSKFKENADKALKVDTINFWIKYIIASKYLDFYTKTENEEYYNKAEKYLKEELKEEIISNKLTKRWQYYKLSLLYFRYSKINNSKSKINDSIKIMEKWIKTNKLNNNDELNFKVDWLSLIQSNYHLLYIITNDKKYLQEIMNYWNEILENLSGKNKIEWNKQYIFLKEVDKLIKTK